MLDAADPLAEYRERFVESDGLVAYLDGNSLGRPLVASVERLGTFAREEWGGRLIRGWDEGWMHLPTTLGDELGRVALAAAPGQTAIADSTTVVLYKLLRAATDARPGRTEIVIDRDNFPTDRYLVEGVARERGLTVRWVDTPHDGGVTPDLVAEAVGPDTAVALFSSVAYRSAWLADIPAITEVIHDAGALVIWDLCHSAGVVPTPLDEWGVDLAVGCGYKYLNGGPGAPAFLYVRSELQSELTQPIQGWMGSSAPFEMGQGYEAAAGIRGFLSGTPSIVAMQPMRDMIALIDEVGIEAVRAKSVALTEFAIELVDEVIPDATLASPREATRRGGHITIDHPRFAQIMPHLWGSGVIPDFRRPDGIRLGLSPLSTSFAEIEAGVRAIAAELG
ncbi:kynureninase [Microbacteriaceae bacterium SG_E_30_P1]|uniref:Kynureninase n=1 Tax=Antiquaquibacter oligotrophicus TaxID=2880260 RepID=A0ABT6KQG9_9MICO|nr:aminotransferase class V-fold PLP-dependent enzyme [Antiquaquibacter oligotrophicus]MDH6182223.1 kynureninase [Antiquaquibacter oligotrophicus]UDF12117.1 aminotransferase class V-fold PLP-dependent enzyme [Antiquaquibacter oligotrophicus]